MQSTIQKLISIQPSLSCTYAHRLSKFYFIISHLYITVNTKEDDTTPSFLLLIKLFIYLRISFGSRLVIHFHIIKKEVINVSVDANSEKEIKDLMYISFCSIYDSETAKQKTIH